MADAIISIVVDRLAHTIVDHVWEEFNFLRGAKKDVLYLSSELETIRNLLNDAERRGFKEISVKKWLNKLQAVSYELDDVLDEWNYHILKCKIERNDENMTSHKVCAFSPILFFKKLVVRRGVAKKIKELKEKIELIVEEKDQFMFMAGQLTDHSLSRIRSTSFMDASEIYGRGSDRDVLLNKLMFGGDTSHPKEYGNAQILCISGAGGIGKTALAQMIYNDAKVSKYFDLKLWVCVSYVFDEVRIAKGILECANGNCCIYMNELEMLLKHVSDSVSGKRFLLVLDDVWNEDYRKWEPLINSLQHGGFGSKILVTTRNERVASIMGTKEIHRLGQLSDLDCCLLLRHIAFFGKDEEKYKELMQDISWKIAEKCKGLPLAAKAIGSLLRFKKNLDEWENVLQSETWELEEKTELFPHLLVSYAELSPALKRCFSYCSIFRKNSRINVAELIKQWIALGYLSSTGKGFDLELRGREYFDNLAMRSFFQDFERSDEAEGRIISCKMHDIVHDFAKFIKKSNMDGNSEDDVLVSQAKEYRSLFCEKELPPCMFKSLKCLKVLSLRHAGTVPREIERLIQLRYLDLNYTLANQVMKSICKLYNLETLYLSQTNLAQVPEEIGKLVQLRDLDLSRNPITELPDSICNLKELRTLNVEECTSLGKIPDGINRLENLRHFCNSGTAVLRFPEEFWAISGLRTLNEIYIGKGCNGFGCLKNMNQIGGFLCLFINLSSSDEGEKDFDEARKAGLGRKVNVRELSLLFSDRTADEESSKVVDVMDVVGIPPNLHSLFIYNYNGFKFPNWITSSLKFIREFKAYNVMYCSSLPAFGKLPCLEIFSLGGINGLQFLGREFLGLTSEKTVGFPKLEKLSFGICPEWKEWEDITVEEEESDDVIVMPCLKHLEIRASGLRLLPHGLLRKASAIEELWIQGSPNLKQVYQDKNGSAWKSISHIPRFNF